MIIGFLLAAYSVVGNDVIQTLGTFLASNSRRPWWALWLFAGLILSVVMLYGWWAHNGDVSYGRLANIPLPGQLSWWHILPPLVLLAVTSYGVPVSTTFMVLSVFSSRQVIGEMVLKSVLGYGVAFIVAMAIYWAIARRFENRNHPEYENINPNFWMAAQWCATGFLWSQWLIQDFANIFVYLPRQLSLAQILGALGFLLILLAVIFRMRGGKIQEIVENKANTENLRSATLIDLTYGVVLYFFTAINPIPMSTTWTFVGILAGREYAISLLLKNRKISQTHNMVFGDLARVNLGLAISIVLAFIIRSLG